MDVDGRDHAGPPELHSQFLPRELTRWMGEKEKAADVVTLTVPMSSKLHIDSDSGTDDPVASP